MSETTLPLAPELWAAVPAPEPALLQQLVTLRWRTPHCVRRMPPCKSAYVTGSPARLGLRQFLRYSSDGTAQERREPVRQRRVPRARRLRAEGTARATCLRTQG